MDELEKQSEDGRGIGSIEEPLPEPPLIPNAQSRARRLTGRAQFWLVFAAVTLATIAAYGAIFWLIRQVIRTWW